MKREIHYQWRVRELMARAGMRTSRELVQPLRDRGVTLSPSQVYRIVGKDPERISLQVLVALCDIFNVEANDILTYTSTAIRGTARKVAGSAAEVPLLEAYRPVRARIIDDSEDDV